jgi:hypothetical protein
MIADRKTLGGSKFLRSNRITSVRPWLKMIILAAIKTIDKRTIIPVLSKKSIRPLFFSDSDSSGVSDAAALTTVPPPLLEGKSNDLA